jgi:hypothetical protein
MKKYLVAATVAVVVFAISAFAASLNVTAGTLQAGHDAIDKCIENSEEAVAVSYGEATYDEDAGKWTVEEVTVDHGGDCAGLAYQVLVADTDGKSLASEGGTFDPDETVQTAKVEFAASFDAEAATDVHLVIRNASS